jgi:hypothetical protein
MTLIQKFITTILPKSWAADIQAESESWLLTCPNCGTVRSIWDIGGVRYKAYPKKKKALVRCTQCKETRMMPLEYNKNP